MSSKSEIAVSVRGLSKSYTIAHQGEKHSTLAETLLAKARHPFKRAPNETFWALKDVNFDIKKGEVVGIIGRNGAGKSTLLKILSRITEPTAGQIDLYGRVGSLLEVGTGFHPELTGRENIFLNGAILGMTKAEIRKQFEAIVDFAGVEKFLDTPVKRYSSGMYVRLAFAVAANLQSEILIVDEVLAVGDAEFQGRCIGKMKDVAASGRTVLFVSHNMQSISLLCSRGLFLSGGQVGINGTAEQAIEAYVTTFSQASATQDTAHLRPGSGEYRFIEAEADTDVFAGDKPKAIHFKLKHRRSSLGRMYLSAHIVDPMGAVVAQCDSRLVGHWLDDAEEHHGTLLLSSPWLKPGQYRVDLFVCAAGIVDRFDGACYLTVSPVIPYPFSASEDSVSQASVFADFNWQRNATESIRASDALSRCLSSDA